MLNQLVRLVKTLHQDAGIEGVALHMEYVLRALKSNEQQRAFEEALRRTVSGQGGEIMTYVHRMIDEGRREARQEGRREGIREGELRGRLQTIRGLLGSELPWSIIEAATGIDEAASRRLKQQLDDNGSGRAEWVRPVPRQVRYHRPAATLFGRGAGVPAWPAGGCRLDNARQGGYNCGKDATCDPG